MSRIITYLNKKMLEDIHDLSKNSKKSVFETAAELIEIGYNLKKHKETQIMDKAQTKMEELVSRHTQYLLRIMATSYDVLRCVRNEKSKYSEKTTEEAIKKIETNTIEFINDFIKRD